MKYILLLTTNLILVNSLAAQDDLLNLLEEEDEQTTEFVDAIFKGTRLINGHSVKTRKKGTLDFMISHRFGEINSGAYNFFGLDDSNIRIGLEYGITDRLYVGFARNSFEKTFDGFGKYRLIRQSSGIKNMPFSVTLFSSIAIKTLRIPNEEQAFSDKLAFTNQLLIARKITSALSLQLMPSHPGVIVILGKRGSGKTALGYRLLELLRGRTEPYVVALPSQAQNMLPEWVGLADNLEPLTKRVDWTIIIG